MNFRSLFLLLLLGLCSHLTIAQTLQLKVGGNSSYSDDQTKKEIINPGFSVGLEYDQLITKRFGVLFGLDYLQGNFWITKWHECVVFFTAPRYKYTYNSAVTSSIEHYLSFYYRLSEPSKTRDWNIKIKGGYMVARLVNQKTKKIPYDNEKPKYVNMQPNSGYRNHLAAFVHGAKAGVEAEHKIFDNILVSYSLNYQFYLFKQCIDFEYQNDFRHFPELAIGIGYHFQ